MKIQPSKERAESRVVIRYIKLYKPLIELIDALQDLEPGGTLVDDITISKNPGNKVHLEYVAHPVTLRIKDDSKIFILRVSEEAK
jgi:hypothetical protein